MSRSSRPRPSSLPVARLTAGLALLLLLVLPGGAAKGVEYPLAPSADGRHIVDQTGTPIFINMEAGWFVLGRTTREEATLYLDNRVAKGFNAILIQFPLPEWFGDPTNAYGEPPFLVPGDFSTPNEAYFEHANWLVQQALDRDLILFLAPAYLGWQCVNEGFCAEMRQSGESKMRDWGRWIGSRYKTFPNIVWVHGGDTDAGDHGVMHLVDAVADGIMEVDPDRLHTAHCRRYSSAADCYDRPWLNLNSTYADCQQTPALIRADYQRTPRRPYFLIEARYEDEYDWTEVCMRSQAYWSLLGGASGHTFGNHWVHSFTGAWPTEMESTGSHSMVHFGNLVRSRPWHLLEPDIDNTVLTSGAGSIEGEDFAAAARAADGSWLMVYAPSPRTLTVDLDQLRGIIAEAWWFNPATGSVHTAGVFASAGLRSFDPPSNQDWVLMVDDLSSNLNDFWDVPTASDLPAAGLRVALESVAPNPFNPRTQITFSAPEGQEVTVRAYDLRGRQVATLFRGRASGGRQTLSWDARGLASGTYLVQVESDGVLSSRKAALIK